MPDLVRWPKFRENFVSESEQKIYDLVYVVDSHSVVSRGLQELALDAFSNSLTQAEARILIAMFVHKDRMANKSLQTQADNKSGTLRLDSDWDLKEE